MGSPVSKAMLQVKALEFHQGCDCWVDKKDIRQLVALVVQKWTINCLI